MSPQPQQISAEQTKEVQARTTASTAVRLGPGHRSRKCAPVRIVHLGLGAFHRSHQAWYTQHASDAQQWGIAAFTGRSPEAARILQAQDGLYTLIERGEDGDRFELVESIVQAVDGADLKSLVSLLEKPQTAVVTLTITEAGYHLNSDGALNLQEPQVAADIEALRHDGVAAAVTTALARLVLGLLARRAADAGPISVICCDNLAENGAVVRAAVRGMAAAVNADLDAWVADQVAFVSTSIDRITPQTTDAELRTVAESCGYLDESPVVAEPFRDWVLSGEFPAGRPRWEDAGARFVQDITPYENRKLWLLNGAHSLLAYAGLNRGHETVAQALADVQCREAVEAFWDEAQHHLQAPGLDIPGYREALLLRFANPRIAHYLAQIAMDGSTKVRLRALPVLSAERAAGRSGAAALRIVAEWIHYVRSADAQNLRDSRADDLRKILAGPEQHQVSALLALLDPALAEAEDITAQIPAAQSCPSTP